MLITTTDIVDGRQVYEYHGIVSGQSIVGATIFKDIFAGFRDFFGGRSKSYEKTLNAAREEAIADMSEAAKQKGCDAVIGMDIEYQVIGRKNSMLMVAVTGSAVRLR